MEASFRGFNTSFWSITYLAKAADHKYTTWELSQSNYKPLLKLRNRMWPASEVPTPLSSHHLSKDKHYYDTAPETIFLLLKLYLICKLIIESMCFSVSGFWCSKKILMRLIHIVDCTFSLLNSKLLFKYIIICYLFDSW